MKKVLSLVLLLALALSVLVSCGGKADDSVIVIGGIGPLTGDYANYGTSVKKGAEAGIAYINDIYPDGVNGFKFKLKFEDSAGDPDAAKTAYGKLVDKHMRVSLGGTLSGETSAVVAEADADGMLVLTPSGSAVSAIAGSNQAFRVCFSDPLQGKASADYIKQYNLAANKKVAVFYQSDLDYSKGLLDTFKAEWESFGGDYEIVELQTFTKTTNTDFSTQIDAIAASGADLVFIPIYAAEAASFLTQAKEKNKLSEMIAFGCDGLDGILSKLDDVKTANGVMMLTPFSADSTADMSKKFVEYYKKKNANEVPDQFAADGFDAILTIVAAIQQANLSVDDMTNFNARLVAAMTQIEVTGATGTMQWTADGEPSKDALAMVYRDGVAVLFQ